MFSSVLSFLPNTSSTPTSTETDGFETGFRGGVGGKKIGGADDECGAVLDFLVM